MNSFGNCSDFPKEEDLNNALEALSAGELRTIIKNTMSHIDGQQRGYLIDAIIDRAARTNDGWTPAAPSDKTAMVEHLNTTIELAIASGYIEPEKIDALLREGKNAFLRKEYDVVIQIFGNVVPPTVSADFDMGYPETPDEVLSIDLD